jgi:hypothetical protein
MANQLMHNQQLLTYHYRNYVSSFVCCDITCIILPPTASNYNMNTPIQIPNHHPTAGAERRIERATIWPSDTALGSTPRQRSI